MVMVKNFWPWPCIRWNISHGHGQNQFDHDHATLKFPKIFPVVILRNVNFNVMTIPPLKMVKKYPCDCDHIVGSNRNMITMNKCWIIPSNVTCGILSWSWSTLDWPYDHGNFRIMAMVMVKFFLTILTTYVDSGQMVKKSWSLYPP